MKRIWILTAILVLGLSAHALAGGKVLSDSAMDEVNAGDWVLLNDGTQDVSVADVYTNNNTLDLMDQSQSKIQAVSNANAIDSAIAAQANIARVTGDTPTDNVAVEGSNYADLTNYRPADNSTESSLLQTVVTSGKSSSMSSKADMSDIFDMAGSETSGSASASSSFRDYNLNENADADLSFAESCVSIGKTIGTGAASLTADADYNKVETDVSGSDAAASAYATKDCAVQSQKASTCELTMASDESTSTSVTTESSKTTRSSKGANNHIALLATSQQEIKAVSNLNAVASGAAIQTNIASNVGVSGTITHLNSATVSSGF